MAKKFNIKNKKMWKNIGLGCLAGALCIGAVAGLGALSKQADETTKVINPSFAIGGLTETGSYLETEESIYTKDAFSCRGLDVELDFDNNISYRIFFYDDENDFLSSTSKLTSNYDETTTPIDANFARIVITPNDDDKISWYEKSRYANQIEISVDKEQNTFVSYSKELDEIATKVNMKYLGQGNNQNGTFTATTESPLHWYSSVDTTGFDELIIKVENGTLEKVVNVGGSDVITCYFLDTTNTLMAPLKDLNKEIICEEGDFTYYSIDVSARGVLQISLDYGNSNGFDVWVR